MIGRSAACGFDECRRKVDRFDQTIVRGAARNVCGRVRIVNDQGHAHAFLVEKLLFAEPMVAEIIAVVAGDDDKSVFKQPAFVEEMPEPTEMIVDLLDQPHIHRDYGCAHLLAREVDTPHGACKRHGRDADPCVRYRSDSPG